MAAPSFLGLVAASPRSSASARAASSKRDTTPEIALRRALWRRGLRYRIDVADLPGRPDIVFPRARVAVFCDGDFWHGRNLRARLARLSAGHNAGYWTAKIRANVERDLRFTRMLEEQRWLVLRFWESDVAADLERIASQVTKTVRRRSKLPLAMARQASAS